MGVRVCGCWVGVGSVKVKGEGKVPKQECVAAAGMLVWRCEG